MKVLVLTQRVPYPPDRGDKITTWHVVDHFRREHEVSIVCFSEDEADDRAARALEEMGLAIRTFRPRGRLRSLPTLLGSRPLTLSVFGSKELHACVDQEARDADVAYAYSSSMGAFLIDQDLPRLMNFAELDSDKWRQYAGFQRFPMSWIYAREARALRGFEKRLAAAVEENLVCTPLEKEIFEREIPGATATVVRNGVDLDYYRPRPELAEPDHLVFVGVMDYYPNVDGCVWFCEEILPLVRVQRPHARLSIVGARPNARTLRLAHLPGVEVTGRVEDTRRWLERASVSVAPLRIARGIQNKVMEALAMGLPLVATRTAAQGVDGVLGQDYLVADEPQTQAQAIVELLEAPERARELGRNARALVESRFSWDTCLRPLDALLAKYAPTV